ncbi:hypothetical protein PWT90_09057 [Aphanocladium album]|nr:hypothetical protein PWT90_09057 [Aphanocladium album]
MPRFLNCGRLKLALLRRLGELLAWTWQCLGPVGGAQLNGRIRIVCIADTHSLTQPIPPGDVLIHAGDLTRSGTLSELCDTIAWLKSQPHAHKIVIAGNADLCLDPTIHGQQAAAAIEWGDIAYLCTSAITLDFAVLERELKIFGDPHVLRCGADDEEAFQYDAVEDYWAGTIPSGTDVVVTHGPPQHILDEWDGSSEGCPSLYRAVAQLRPALHLFGHVHPAHGKKHVFWGDQYERSLHSVIQKMRRGDTSWRTWISMIIALPKSIWSLLRRNVFGWRGSSEHTIFINASAMSEDGTHLKNHPIVVDI